MRRHHCLALFGAAGLAFPALPAVAQQPGANDPPEQEIVVIRRLPPSRDQLRRTVWIGDLDLATSVGEQEMGRRVETAVRHMCTREAPIPLHGETMSGACEDEVWQSARAQMMRALERVRG